MAVRAYWKGHLRLSLVTIGIELYTATKSASRPSLHQYDRKSGKRIRYQKVAEGVGPVDKDDIVKGYETSKNEYVVIEPEELDEIKLESKRTIDLIQFVDSCEIDPRYFEKPYYVVPKEDEVAEEGFTVIREALKKAGQEVYPSPGFITLMKDIAGLDKDVASVLKDPSLPPAKRARVGEIDL